MDIECKVESMYERLVEAIDAPSGLALKNVRGRYKILSEMTGIEAKRWQNALTGISKPTVAMTVSITCLLPELASWILTGQTPEPKKLVGGLMYSPTWANDGLDESSFERGGRYGLPAEKPSESF